MSDIDPEKLEAAIRDYTKLYRDLDDGDTQIGLVLAAARKHLATLPHFKEVTFAQWATFTADGEIWSSALSEAAAHEEARQNPNVVAVRLTGTAKVKVTP